MFNVVDVSLGLIWVGLVQFELELDWTMIDTIGHQRSSHSTLELQKNHPVIVFVTVIVIIIVAVRKSSWIVCLVKAKENPNSNNLFGGCGLNNIHKNIGECGLLAVGRWQ